jgi:hypothetical protein
LLDRRAWNVLADLVRLVADAPLRETPREPMLALYRSGRQADALAAQTPPAVRRRAGVDPGPGVRKPHTQDRGLTSQPVDRSGLGRLRTEPMCLRRRSRRTGAGVRPGSRRKEPDMIHRENSSRWAATRRTTARLLYRALADRLDARRGPQWAAAPYPLSGGALGYPIARDAARWRH